MPVYVGVNGVKRKLKEWPVGVGGVARQQKEVWAGVDGVNKKIFSTNPIITITGSGGPLYSCYARVIIGGNTYYSETSLEVPTGTVIRVEANSTEYNFYASIRFNESYVGTSFTDTSGYPAIKYSTSIKSNATIQLRLIPMSYSPTITCIGEIIITGGT